MGDIVGAHIEIVEGAGGPKARIAGSRVRVQDVVMWFHDQGQSVDEIVENIPTINHADVFAALAYYWDHREEIDRKIAEDDAFAEMLRGKTPNALGAKLRRLIEAE